MLSVPSDYLDLEVPLPADLRRFGETTTLRITGRTSAPAVAVLTAAGADEMYADTPRNAPCPCGSGKKYKRCHGDPRNREG